MGTYVSEKKFSFVSNAPSAAEDTFGVVHFTGSEGLSMPYEFTIMLVSDQESPDLGELLAYPACFTVHRDDGQDVDYRGILAELEQLHAFGGYIFYRARLVPKLWWLSLTHHNQVCLDQSVPDIIRATLRDGGLTTLDFETRFRGTYAPLEYVCQYNESHFNFISRWLEREGIYYFFEQTEQGEKVIITDTSIAHTDLPVEATLVYAPPSGMDASHRTEVIQNLSCRQKLLPRKVLLKDYNYQNPSLDVSGEADVDSQGRGESFIYGERFDTPEEGKRLAGIRAQELSCRKREFVGESTVPFMQPGYLFTLERHYRDDFNQKYLVESVTHEGSQVGYLISGVTEGLSDLEKTVYYRNSFTALPSGVQYRPPRTATKPRIAGTLHAFVDAEGEGDYAELDDQGRYKVRLPFDLNDEHQDGRASCFLRMMQPYAHKEGGMHFPLIKGVEVLLTFLDGDPDRPVIAGAVPNPETMSPTTAENQTESVVHAGGKNRIRMEEKEGTERIIMESKRASSYMRIGAPNDPPRIELNGPNPYYLDIGESWNDPGAKVVTVTETDNKTERSEGPTNASGTVDKDTAGNYTITYTDPSDASLTATRKVVVRNPDDIHDDETTTTDGIRICTNDNIYMETSKGYGEYYTGYPSDPHHSIQRLLDNFGDSYNPTGCAARHSGDSQSDFLKDVVRKAHVQVSDLDTVNTQEGNIYDFGGYWNYNLGNAYVEEHIDQCAALNASHSKQWPSDDKLGGYGNRIASGIVKGAANLLSANYVAGAVSMGLQQGLAEKPQKREVGDCMNGGPPADGEDAKAIKTYANKVSGMNSGNTWVEKQFGNAYAYFEGDQIEITNGDVESHNRGNTYEFTYGGTHEETKVCGAGIKTAWSKSGGGISEEKKWDSLSGEFLSYEYNNHGHFKYNLELPRPWPTLAISMSQQNLAMNIAMSQGASINVAFANSFALNFLAAVSGCIDITFAPAGKIEIKNLEVDADFFGFKYNNKPPSALETKVAKIESGQATIAHESMILKSKVSDLDNSTVKLDTVYSVHLMS